MLIFMQVKIVQGSPDDCPVKNLKSDVKTMDFIIHPKFSGYPEDRF